MLKFDERKYERPKGYCQVCEHLVWYGKKVAYCRAVEKYIVPSFPPYTPSNPTCPEFENDGLEH